MGPILNEMFLLEVSPTRVLLPYTLLSILRIWAPILVRAIEGKPPFGIGLEILMVLLITMSASVFQFQAVAFIAAGIISYKRKLFFAKMSGALIDLNDDDSRSVLGMMPTFVFMHRKNIEAWL
jgi:hypothetical protein